MIRRSIELTKAQWKQLEELAEATESIATKGPHKGLSSWRALLRRLAIGELHVKKDE